MSQPDPTEYAVPVAAKLFPAILTAPDGAVTDGLLVILTARTEQMPGRIVAYAEDGPGGIVKAFHHRTVLVADARPDPDHGFGWILTDLDGGRWAVRHGKGCGCKSPLQSLSSQNRPLPLTL